MVTINAAKTLPDIGKEIDMTYVMGIFYGAERIKLIKKAKRLYKNSYLNGGDISEKDNLHRNGFEPYFTNNGV